MVRDVTNLFSESELQTQQGGAQRMIAASFRRRANQAPALAAALGGALQQLREEGFVAASAGRVQRVAASLGLASEAPAWTENDLITTGLVEGPGPGEAPMVLDSGLLYFRLNWKLEKALAQEIADRALQPAIDEPVTLDGDLLNKAQAAAVKYALAHALTVISGGPGTGKTTLVGHLIKAYRDGGGALKDVALAAPTGKAAARLGAAVGAMVGTEDNFPKAKTLHRLLGWSPRRAAFRHNVKHPLAAKLVIVDEVSMVDLHLMHDLLAAVGRDARLVLLGDKDQLVSVQPGSVLSDLFRGLQKGRAEAALHVLKENYRFGDDSVIGQLARHVRHGAGDAAISLLGGAHKEALNWQRQAPNLEPMVKTWSQALAGGDPAQVWAGLQSARILCAHRFGRYGVLTVNAEVQRHLLAAGAAKAPATGEANFAGRLFAVMGNHYGQGFFNGDQGFITHSEGEMTAFVETPEGPLKNVSLARLPTVETAYAMTVHRAQGSEYNQILLVLPDADSPVLTRELLYTAITRAREQVLICGSESALRAAIARPSARGSGLAQRLSVLTEAPPPAPIQQSLF